MSERETRKPKMLGSRRQAQRRRWALAGLLISLLSALKVQAEPFGLQWRDADGAWQNGLAMDTDVQMRIHGLLAEVVVTQHYQNHSQQWQEGRYLLPLPGDAAVGSLRLRIGERVIEGEVREKQEAQRVYQQATAAGQRAGLVEQNRPNLFRTAVSNIGPGESIEVQIGYWQQVSYRDGEFLLALPLTLTPRYQPGGELQPDFVGPPSAGPSSVKQTLGLEPTVSLHAELVAGLPLAAVHSDTHAIHVVAKADSYAIELKDWVEASDRDFELRWRPMPSKLPQRALFTEQVDGETYAMLLMLPPTQPVQALPRELILLVDQSGSMHGSSLQQAIAAVDSALQRLRPQDRFNLVRFNHQSDVFTEQSLPASAAAIALARQWVQELRADGGTEMAPALSRTLALPAVPGYLRQVVLITDAAIGNEEELLQRIEAERGEARLFTVGIGSAPNDYFVRQSARIGQGSFEMVRDISTVAPRMNALFDRIDRPMLSDLQVQWPGAAESYPQQLPDLYAGEPLQIISRLSINDGTVSVSGLAREQEWRDRLPLVLHKQGMTRGIGRLWARAKLEQLQDALRQGASADEVRELSIEVALQHGLASRYTSLVAVEQRVTRPLQEALSSTLIDNAAPAGSLNLAQGASSARSQLGSALALLLLACALLRRDSAKAPGLG